MKALATAKRVLLQLTHDPRTIALIIVAPCLFLVILRYMLDNDLSVFNRMGTLMLGIFPFIMMFVIASIAMLRERSSGTLERLMTLPAAKLSLLSGYGLAFGVVAVVQVVAVTGLAAGALGLEIHHFTGVLVVALASGWLGVALGLFASAFAKSEFQAVQFMPAFILPQLLITGFFVPRASMEVVLKVIADVLPLTYVVDAIQAVAGVAVDASKLVSGIVVIFAFIVAALVGGALTLRRQS